MSQLQVSPFRVFQVIQCAADYDLIGMTEMQLHGEIGIAQFLKLQVPLHHS